MGAPAAPSTTAQPVSYPITTTSTTPSEQLSHAGASWKPSYARPAPVLGLACLFGVVICTAVAAAVLVASDHVSSSQWHQNIAPNVCLSLINSVSNILLAVAVGYGVAIAWWRKVSLTRRPASPLSPFLTQPIHIVLHCPPNACTPEPPDHDPQS